MKNSIEVKVRFDKNVVHEIAALNSDKDFDIWFSDKWHNKNSNLENQILKQLDRKIWEKVKLYRLE